MPSELAAQAAVRWVLIASERASDSRQRPRQEELDQLQFERQVLSEEAARLREARDCSDFGFRVGWVGGWRKSSPKTLRPKSKKRGSLPSFCIKPRQAKACRSPWVGERHPTPGEKRSPKPEG